MLFTNEDKKTYAQLAVLNAIDTFQELSKFFYCFYNGAIYTDLSENKEQIFSRIDKLNISQSCKTELYDAVNESISTGNCRLVFSKIKQIQNEIVK